MQRLGEERRLASSGEEIVIRDRRSHTDAITPIGVSEQVLPLLRSSTPEDGDLLSPQRRRPQPGEDLETFLARKAGLRRNQAETPGGQAVDTPQTEGPRMKEL